jgi:hypothetical protein
MFVSEQLWTYIAACQNTQHNSRQIRVGISTNGIRTSTAIARHQSGRESTKTETGETPKMTNENFVNCCNHSRIHWLDCDRRLDTLRNAP